MTQPRLSELLAAEALDTDGYVVIEGYLDAESVSAAQAVLDDQYPTWEQFSTEPSWFESIASSPDTHWAVNQFPTFPAVLHHNVMRSDLIEFARSYLREDVLMDQSTISAKYAGHHVEDQTLHVDYGNHTFLVPDAAYLTGMLFYTDVSAETGAPWIVSREHTAGVEIVPAWGEHDPDGDIVRHSHPVEAPAGSLLLYRLDTFHRGSGFRAPTGRRFVHHFSYKPASCHWSGWACWPIWAANPIMHQFLQESSVMQRTAMGFPAPADPYWTADRVEAVARRYPDMDLNPYRQACSRTANQSPK